MTQHRKIRPRVRPQKVVWTMLSFVVAFLCWRVGFFGSVSKPESVGSSPPNQGEGPTAPLRTAGPEPAVPDARASTLAASAVKPDLSQSLSPKWRRLVARQGAGYPLLSDVPRVSSEDEAILLQMYRHQDSVIDRCRTIHLLTYGGSIVATELISNALTRDFVGRRLTMDEEINLGYQLQCLGLQAMTNDAALAFLLRAATPEFWSHQRLWESDRPTRAVGWALDHAVIGLGIAGRSEAQAALLQLREVPERVTEFDPAGALVSAMFARDMISEHGLPLGLDIWVEPEKGVEMFSKWQQHSSNGVWWGKWMRLADEQTLQQSRTNP